MKVKPSYNRCSHTFSVFQHSRRINLDRLKRSGKTGTEIYTLVARPTVGKTIFYSKIVMPLIGKLISKDNSAYTYLPESIRAFPQGEVMQQAIQNAGFSHVYFKRLTFGICTLYVATK